MTWSELHNTLTSLVSALEPPSGSGLWVDSAELDVPLETKAGFNRDGLVFYARVPHSRWQAGVLPQVHMSHLRIEAHDETGAAL